MHAHLAHTSAPSLTLQSLAEQASFFLLAVCIRSADGRRRIIAEITSTLGNQHGKAGTSIPQLPAAVLEHNPFQAGPGGPAPHMVSIPPLRWSLHVCK